MEDENKAKIRIFFRGREIVHPEIGRALANKILERVADIGGIDMPPKLEGKNLIMVISPRKALDKVGKTMPKMKVKTNRGAAKRFKVTGSGKIKRYHGGKATRTPRRAGSA